MADLYQELLNNNIEFTYEEGHIVLQFYSTDSKFIVSSAYTNWVDTNIKQVKNKSKYNKMADVKDGYYQGNINDGKLKNSNAVLFKMIVKDGCISSIIRKYIIMIIDNPEYIDNNLINRYYLIIYGIDRIGTMGVQLRVLETFKSSI
jgi:hypothetical protein